MIMSHRRVRTSTRLFVAILAMALGVALWALIVRPVEALPPPSPDNRSTPQVIAGLGSATEINVVSFSKSPDDPTIPCLDDQGSKTAWFSYTPDAYGLLVFDTATGGTDYDTAVAVWLEQPDGSLKLVTSDCTDDVDGLASVVFVSHPGREYLIEVASMESGAMWLKVWLHACPHLPLPPAPPGLCAYPGPDSICEPPYVIKLPVGLLSR